MFALLPFVVFLSVLSASSAKHQPPEFQASEMHKADCNKYESFVVDVAFERTKEGTVIVVGAHNHDNDLWNHLANAKTLNKIFVEPLIPSLFHKFEEDAKSLTNVKVIDAAVTGTDSTNTTIYCTGSAHPGHVVFIDGQDAKHSPIAENIVQTCSLDKERLFLIHDLDVGGDIYTAKKNVLKHMTTHQVDTLSLQSLMDRHVTDRVVMLQIDVEGVDDQIVINIPLESMQSSKGRPHVIIFEHALLDKDGFHKAMTHLHNNFYITCAFHHNIFAYDVQWLQSLEGVDYSKIEN